MLQYKIDKKIEKTNAYQFYDAQSIYLACLSQ